YNPRHRGIRETMSFRVWKGQSESPPPSSKATAVRASLPPDVVEAGAGRLTVLALLTAGINVLLGILDWRIFGRPGAAMPTATVWLGATVTGVGLPLTVAWIAWRRMLAPSTLLDLGLVFEVAQALCISLIFHS